MGNEGCSYPSVKCKKRVTVLVEGGEIELFDGEVSARFPASLLVPRFIRSVYHVFLENRAARMGSHCGEGGLAAYAGPDMLSCEQSNGRPIQIV